jgi:hypothetical protein
MHAFDRNRVIACALSLCASTLFAQLAASEPAQQGADNLPVLYGARLDGSQVAVDVVSFGCTDASYFSVQLDPISAAFYRLSVIAEKRDLCRMSPHIISVTLNIPAVADLAVARFQLANRLAAPVTLRRYGP